MPRLNIFIDGSWLFKICGPGKVLASRTVFPTRSFSIDFSKLNSLLLSHVKKYNEKCKDFGDLYYVTSIFQLPPEIDDWPTYYDYITEESIIIIKKNIYAREMVARNAVASGYKNDSIFHPLLRDYMIPKIKDKRFQEKQVDTSVVALLVRSAILNPEDYHVVITGDSDILPSIQIAYPEYSKNVFIATSHPDELDSQHRQTSFSLSNFLFEIEAIYFQDFIKDIIYADFAYKCDNCNKVFTTVHEIDHRRRAYCTTCASTRTREFKHKVQLSYHTLLAA
ncbi:MAG: hypothetical protein A2014_00100 [Spirochaetes bacterium GWF1_49_6]|nr:MAG: hypothetical protein A2014_00100 [Spirochaetes bacterium GWF1_49_6]